MKRERSEISVIEPTTPLRLAFAAEMAFPGGGMTASGLRREAERGRLVIERIAGKDYTTLAAIDEMRLLCRVQPKVNASSVSARVGLPFEPENEQEWFRSRMAAREEQRKKLLAASSTKKVATKPGKRKS